MTNCNLYIFDSKTQQKLLFKPLLAKQIKLYVCGITVYDDCHIGHARTFIAFDSIVRYLRHIGHNVYYVRNITDIDDKIIKRAKEKNSNVSELTATYIERMHLNFSQLGLLPPDAEPLATEFIPHMLAIIQKLLDLNFAYKTEGGEIFYAIDKFTNYGKLSNRSIDTLTAGHRVEINKSKKNPLDFILWKPAKEDEPSWPSPWGNGRPGWHLECSAMSMHLLGEQFDIHGGGLDLLFPHHENECAQSEAITNCSLANYWMHTGFLTYHAEKMSKSLGNVTTITEILKQVKPEVLKLLFLSTHYRSNLDFSWQQITQAKQNLNRLYTALRDTPAMRPPQDWHDKKNYILAFNNSMHDDFNIPQALTIIWQLVKTINTTTTPEASYYAYILTDLASSIGLLMQDFKSFFQPDNVDADFIEDLIAKRQQARTQQNWEQADLIREQLLALDVILEDNAGKTSWRILSADNNKL